MQYTIYSPNGRVLKSGVRAQVEPPDGEDLLLLEEQADGSTQYVVTTSSPSHLADRQPAPIHVAGSTLSEIPAPATLFVGGQEFRVQEASVELAIDEPGRYGVVLTPDDPQWLDWIGEVVV